MNFLDYFVNNLVVIDEKEAEKTAKRMQDGKFDLEDFLSALKQVKKMGPLENLLKLIPGARNMGLSNIQINPKDIKRGIIYFYTRDFYCILYMVYF